SDVDISAVKIYEDTGDSVFNAGDDTLLSSGTDIFSSDTVTVDLAGVATPTITGSPSIYFIVFDISNTAVTEVTIGAECVNNTYFTFINGAASPANLPFSSSAPTIRPPLDLHIKNYDEGTYIGDDIHNLDGTNQAKSQTTLTDLAAVYHIRIENDNTASETFSITGTAGGSGWSLVYYDQIVGGGNITAGVTGAGGWEFTLGASSTKEIRVEVTPDITVPNNETKDVFIGVNPQNTGQLADVVKCSTEAKRYQPDNQIRNYSEPSPIGNDIYNTDGTDQTRSQIVNNLEVATYYIKIQNDGGDPDTISVTGTAGDADWTVQYFDDLGFDITSDITGSTYFFELDPDDSLEIRCEVTPDADVPGDTSFSVYIAGISTLEPGQQDIVKANTRTSSNYRPDNQIKAPADPLYLGNNIYNNDGTNQTKTGNIGYDIFVTYYIKIENDGLLTDSFSLTGISAPANWVISYYDELAGGNDITLAVISPDGWSDGLQNLTSGASKNIRAEIKVDPAVPAGTEESFYLTAISITDTLKSDTVKLTLTTVNAQPDNLIQLATESYPSAYTWNGAPYNIDGAGQTKSKSVLPEVLVSYYIKVENDGETSDTFILTGTAGDSDWTVSYYDALSGGTEITSQLTGAGWSTGVLGLGGAKEIRVEITPGIGAAAGIAKDIYINSTSNADNNKRDTVKATTTPVAFYKPDNHIKNSTDGSYIGDNEYNLDGTNQTKNQPSPIGQTITYHIKLQNDGNTSDIFKITGTAGNADWTVSYFTELTGGSDKTSSVTGSGYNISVPKGGWKYFRVEVTAQIGLAAGEFHDVFIQSVSTNDNAKEDVVKCVSTVPLESQVDNLIQLYNEAYPGSYINNDAPYNEDGAGQTKSANVDTNQTVTYYIKVENDGSGSDKFIMTGTPGSSGWSVSYYTGLTGGTNITGDITGASWTTDFIAVGNNIEIRVEVSPDNTVPGGSVLDLYIASESTNQINKRDTVKAVATANNTYQADNLIKNSGESVYIGEHIWNSDGTNQTKAQTVDPDNTVIYHIQIQNDGNNAEAFSVTGTDGGSGWTLTYYDALSGGTDITTEVTGSQWETTSMAIGEIKYIRVEISPDMTVAGNSTKEVYIVSSSGT
ncbi:MAG: hypothetical protein KAS70_03060, partial [Planctomycetes bacterium]|nr:hypothetical protein [Planctomycetota bacterium]